LNGRQAVYCGNDAIVRLWDPQTGKESAQFSANGALTTKAAFSPDGHQLLTAGWDGSARLWNTATGDPLVELSGHTNRVTAIGYSPDALRAVTASLDNTVRLWNPRTGKELTRLGQPRLPVMSLVFSPTGRDIAAASWDGNVWLWHLPLDLSVAWQVFPKAAEAASAEPATRQAVWRLLGGIDNPDPRLRAAAFQSLDELGPAILPVLMHLSPEETTPEQQTAVDLLLANYSRIPTNLIERLQTDRGFLSECARSEILPLRNAAAAAHSHEH
jgi:hypothetical protein